MWGSPTMSLTGHLNRRNQLFKSACWHGVSDESCRHLPVIMRNTSNVLQVQCRQKSWPCLRNTTSHIKIEQQALPTIKIFDRLTLQITKSMSAMSYSMHTQTTQRKPPVLSNKHPELNKNNSRQDKQASVEKPKD